MASSTPEILTANRSIMPSPRAARGCASWGSGTPAATSGYQPYAPLATTVQAYRIPNRGVECEAGMPSSSGGNIFARKTSLFRSNKSPPPGTVDEQDGSSIPILQAQHHRRDSSILSLTNSVQLSVQDLGNNVRRSVSLRSHRSQHSGASLSLAHRARYPSSGTASSLSPSPKETFPPPSSGSTGTPPPSSRGKSSTSKPFFSKTKRVDEIHRLDPAYHYSQIDRTLSDEPVEVQPPLTATGDPPKTGHSMLAAPFGHALKRQETDRPSLSSQSSFVRDTSSSQGTTAYSAGTNGIHTMQPNVPPTSTAGGHSPQAIHQQIHDVSAKRMATIDYLRKMHQGDIYYFSTFHYTTQSLSSMPSLNPHRIGRRASNYLLLGYSLPALLELNSGSPLEYLKALSALLQEFETYQNLTSLDGSSSLSRGRVGQMFKSGMGLANRTGKGRRASTAADSLALDTHIFSLPTSASSAPSPQEALLPSPINHNQGFQHLLTPHLPFDPDFNTTFATLCDTLIDTYSNLLLLLSGPELCGPGVVEAFAKADKSVRKILVANVVREFEDSARAGVKGEVASLGRVVLGGLM